VVAFLVGGLAGAAEAPSADVNKIIDEVKTLATKARKERSADPWLLQALDDLVNKYYWPWRVQVVDETFKDGDYTRSPAWEVAAGNFWIDSSLGLRSKATVATTAKSEPEKEKKKKMGDLIRDAVKAEMEKGKPAPAKPETTSAALADIYLPAQLKNAFAVDLTFSQHQPAGEQGRIEFGVFEGTRRDRGYVLALTGGKTPMLELLRVKGTATSVVEEQALASDFRTGDAQRLVWRRDPQGGMVVMLNDKTLLETSDRGLTQSFRSFGVTNRGGDYALRKVTLFTTQ
jgi:hypothetical protein